MKNVFVVILTIIVISAGVYFILSALNIINRPVETTTTVLPLPTSTPVATPQATTTPIVEELKDGRKTILGKSVDGREISAYQYGKGEKELLFVAGMHGGYAWNTTLLAYEMMDYFMQNPGVIPANVKVTIIPTLNPDGLFKAVGTESRFTLSDAPKTLEETIPTRFNGNNVDINRNFDCDWQTQGTWQNKTVSGGSKVFSEPESLAIKNYVEKNRPTAVITWYSSVGGVFSSNCHNGVLPETTKLTQLFADASGYPAHEEFNYYEITGDMVNWFAKQNIPAISVLLTTHDDIELDKNKAGVEAILSYYK
jgi:hypothetical protein